MGRQPAAQLDALFVAADSASELLMNRWCSSRCTASGVDQPPADESFRALSLVHHPGTSSFDEPPVAPRDRQA